ncbi:type II toxin-antitoxin system HicB family antitoxin [uncultured Clostridium sp.]|uniref:type II toxin-antitoxin system HicB family antitoxin n=1 Tax=uncultured Clostridium sp. TaxID=59620 RepID=UPI00258FEEBE|nr:type II toxin-antitoxin system HicB family antitoxin [uncultured Clostridium sp.]
MINKYIFFATLNNNNNQGYSVSFCDLNIKIETKTNDIPIAIKQAKELLQMELWEREEREKNIPIAKKPEEIETKKGEFLYPISVYMPDVRLKMNQKAVKKTLTLPYWLNVIAEEEKVNFSDLLQNAIKKQLDIDEDYLYKKIK